MNKLLFQHMLFLFTSIWHMLFYRCVILLIYVIFTANITDILLQRGIT